MGQSVPDGLKIQLNEDRTAVMAIGVDLKNSLCLTGNGYAHLSGIYGDLNDPAVYLQVSEVVQQVHDIDALACDLHPDLQSTRLAMQLAGRLDVPLMQVQHHHAHVAAVVAEHGIEEPVVGLAMDGFGYGDDGQAWGGECLYVDANGYRRAGSIKPVAMPGGDAASRQPWRMAVAWLGHHALLTEQFKDEPVEAVRKLCESSNTRMTSSAGRLFDAASAIVLGSREVGFEGEAAIALEQEALRAERAFELTYHLSEVDGALQLDCRDALGELADAVAAGGESKPALAAGFHRMLAAGMSEMAVEAARSKGVHSVVLAGGCFLNVLLREQITSRLEKAGLQVLISDRVPQGDGAIALGQAWVASYRIKHRTKHRLKRGDT